MTTNKSRPSDDVICRIPPYFYLHVLDQTTNVTRIEVGPKTYIRQDNEKIILGASKMVVIPPSHYCTVENPIVRNEQGDPVFDTYGQVKLRHADREVRLEQEPFPLFPGEVLKEQVTKLKIVHTNAALRLRALRTFNETDKVQRIAGDEWLFEGPGTYIPRIEVEVVETVKATILRPNQALKLRAKTETKDRDGKPRVSGEEWLVRKIGAYLPGAYEEVLDIVNAHVLSETQAIRVRATKTFIDDKGVARKNGEEWLVKFSDTETYIPDVYENVIAVIDITTLTNRQYCIILDPVGENGKPQLGQKKLVKGEVSFFLRPGERLDGGIRDIYVLNESQGLILSATQGFKDTNPEIVRQPGDRWMIRGPNEYIPPVEVEVISRREAIPLDDNEGIYVRDNKTGKVRSVIAKTYMLTQDEEVWAKELPPAVESLLASEKDPLAEREIPPAGVQQPRGVKRNKHRVVTYRVPHNAAVQVYDYKEKRARVTFGPDLVMLGPDEQFTMLSLSGMRPKKPHAIKALCLLLGPDFFTDIIIVETADHARLQLQISYNWHFDVGNKTPDDAAKLFSIPDFVGDACKAIASRIRGAVAGIQFDDFHKNSARQIYTAVFGLDENLKPKHKLCFPQNNLTITSVDIQSVEPVDQRTRDSLQKSVQLAIEITTNSQEAAARHEAQRVEQQARGKLERQRINDEAEAEKARKELLELQALSAAVESCGQAKAEAQSKAESARIEGEAAVELAKLKAQALIIESEAELVRLGKARESEIEYNGKQNELEINKTGRLADIECKNFKESINCLGPETIRDIARAGPDLQVRLLQSLGIKSTIITDGKTPINLFGTAQGLIGSGTIATAALPERI